MTTVEGESMSQLIAGYVDILLKRRKDMGKVEDVDDSAMAAEELVAPVRSTPIGAFLTQPFSSRTSSILPPASHLSPQTTYIVFLPATTWSGIGYDPDAETRGQDNVQRPVQGQTLDELPGHERALPNLALRKPAKQSSICCWSNGGANDAQGGNDGTFNGYGFHTDCDKNAWWQVDLGKAEAIGEVRVYNNHCHDRARTLRVLLSPNEQIWETVYTHNGNVWHGALRISLTGKKGRFVRVQLAEKNYLHLEQIEVYPPPPTAKAEKPSGAPTLSPSASTPGGRTVTGNAHSLEDEAEFEQFLTDMAQAPQRLKEREDAERRRDWEESQRYQQNQKELAPRIDEGPVHSAADVCLPLSTLTF